MSGNNLTEQNDSACADPIQFGPAKSHLLLIAEKLPCLSDVAELFWEMSRFSGDFRYDSIPPCRMAKLQSRGTVRVARHFKSVTSKRKY